MFNHFVTVMIGRIDRMLDQSTWGSCPHPAAARAQYATPRGRVVACERCGRVELGDW
jgi:hypothetical protein